jgi:hypothetical protein
MPYNSNTVSLAQKGEKEFSLLDSFTSKFSFGVHFDKISNTRKFVKTFISDPVQYGLYEYLKVISERGQDGYVATDNTGYKECVEVFTRDGYEMVDYVDANVGKRKSYSEEKEIVENRGLIYKFHNHVVEKFEEDRKSYKFF